MLSLSTTALAVAMLVSSCLILVCGTPPNPTPQRQWRRDRVWALMNSTLGKLATVIILGMPFYHTGLALCFPDMSVLCPRAETLNYQLFTWNRYTLTSLLIITCIGAPVRLTAYRGLGQRFTFSLAPPDKLITSGIYRYIQHPSYTGGMIMLLGALMTFFRWDAAPACWVPSTARTILDGWGAVVSIAVFVLASWICVLRVRDEEPMLRETFGQQWIEWHQSTRRFIPGVV
ncbi:prenyl cysteine carboxyl methyltransferase [Purpureocillium lavendulum]|uniref:Protein-S-isoprenylcysteine O-methyltransferase n=1 Tax=Purpureocillium lavendulum TaxID=1247861 RepID=A0AB34FHD6_9HYPO|nr:prenyl cysteine carboxyl methyltransferase [Purpureocillium lavendulum]